MAEDRRQPRERPQRIVTRPDGRLFDEAALERAATTILVRPQVQLTLELEEAKALYDWAAAALAAPGANIAAWPIALQLHDVLAAELGYIVVEPPRPAQLAELEEGAPI